MDFQTKKIYYSIKEVAAQFGEAESTLRYWENEFSEYVKPRRNEKGVRFYKEKDIENVRVIYHLLRERKLTIEGAQNVLKNSKGKVENQSKIMQHLKNVRDELKALSKEFNEAERLNAQLTIHN